LKTPVKPRFYWGFLLPKAWTAKPDG
jgi:hypothetical protein